MRYDVTAAAPRGSSRSRSRRAARTWRRAARAELTITIDDRRDDQRQSSGRSTWCRAPAGCRRCTCRWRSCRQGDVTLSSTLRPRADPRCAARPSTCTVTAQNNGSTATDRRPDDDASTDDLRIVGVDGATHDRQPRGPASTTCGDARRARWPASRRSTRARARPGTCRSTAFGDHPDRRSATRTSSTSTCRRSSYNGVTYTPDRRRLQRLPRRRWRHARGQQLLQPAGRARTRPAEQHPGAVLDRPRRHGCPGHPRRHADRRRRTLDRRRVAGQRVRHDVQPALPGLDRRRTAAQDITFAYDPPPCPATPGQDVPGRRRERERRGRRRATSCRRRTSWSPSTDPTGRSVDLHADRAGPAVGVPDGDVQMTCAGRRRHDRRRDAGPGVERSAAAGGRLRYTAGGAPSVAARAAASRRGTADRRRGTRSGGRRPRARRARRRPGAACSGPPAGGSRGCCHPTSPATRRATYGGSRQVAAAVRRGRRRRRPPSGVDGSIGPPSITRPPPATACRSGRGAGAAGVVLVRRPVDLEDDALAISAAPWRFVRSPACRGSRHALFGYVSVMRPTRP